MAYVLLNFFYRCVITLDSFFGTSVIQAFIKWISEHLLSKIYIVIILFLLPTYILYRFNQNVLEEVRIKISSIIPQGFDFGFLLLSTKILVTINFSLLLIMVLILLFAPLRFLINLIFYGDPSWEEHRRQILSTFFTVFFKIATVLFAIAFYSKIFLGYSDVYQYLTSTSAVWVSIYPSLLFFVLAILSILLF